MLWKRLFLAIFDLRQGKCCNGSTEPICSRWSPCFLVQGKNTCCISETSKLNSWPSQLPPIERNPSKKWKVTGKFNSTLYIYICLYNNHLTCNIIFSISNTTTLNSFHAASSCRHVTLSSIWIWDQNLRGLRGGWYRLAIRKTGRFGRCMRITLGELLLQDCFHLHHWQP